MKLLEIDWQAFLQVLEAYRRLPHGARRIIMDKAQPSQAIPNAVMGEWREPLLESGLMVAGPQGKNAQVDRRFQGFARALRALGRNRIFNAPSRETFHAFVSENFEGPEIAAFSGAGRQYYYYQDYSAVQGVFGRVCSVTWVRDFLGAAGPEWETPFQAPGRSAYFSSGEVVHAAQTLIQKLSPGAVPVPMAQLPGMCPGIPLDTLALALLAGVRYLLVFPCLMSEGLEPALGLWPAVARRLSAEVPKPPAAVTVTDTFHSPYLVEDMTAILGACAIGPPRLRVSDSQIFEASLRSLLAALGTLPEWVEREFPSLPESRIKVAIDFLRHFEFLADRGMGDREYRLEITNAGSGWFGLSRKDRLKAVLDGLRDTPARDSPVVSLAPPAWGMYIRPEREAFASGLLAAFGGLAEDRFVRRREFLAFHREAENPIAAIFRQARNGMLRIGGRYLSSPSSEELEELWERALADFLHLRLLPLGGVKIGKDRSGAVCLAITGEGRYLLRAAKDFSFEEEPPGRILLQPNCDIVFLAPSAKAEAEIARFCERTGRHVGTLFRVTKQSILAAAAAGLTAGRVLDTLREHCAAELPPNVEQEIAGWFRQYREVKIIPALLIHCPDSETAARILAAAGNRATRLSDTTLEWREQRPQPALVKKLKEMGIFMKDSKG